MILIASCGRNKHQAVIENTEKQTKKNETLSFAEIECPLGVRNKFQLSDGSTGYFNSGSWLKYPVQFIGERKVELSGEAFFDVAHNAEIPFHVNTRNLDIKVLGTTFNLIANEVIPPYGQKTLTIFMWFSTEIRAIYSSCTFGKGR